MRPFQRRLVRWSSWATGITGLVYLWMEYVLVPAEPWAAINHPLQPWVLKAHILVSPVLVFAVGTIAVDHVWRHWLSGIRAGRRSGALLALVVVPMVLSGYLIQAVTHPGWLSATAWAHIGLGVLFLAGLVAHLEVFRRGRRPRAMEDAGSGSRAGEDGASSAEGRRRVLRSGAEGRTTRGGEERAPGASERVRGSGPPGTAAPPRAR